MLNICGKVALITGGSSGIGLAIARAFFEAGMKVAVTYRTQAHLDEARKRFSAANERFHAIAVDVRNRVQLENTATDVVGLFGALHVLVLNAGVSMSRRLADCTYDDWDWVIGVNLTGAFNTIRAALPHMLSHREGGHIIGISSVFGLVTVPTMGAYAASKFGMMGLLETLRDELRDADIGVSIICPGPVWSNIADSERNRSDAAMAQGITITKSAVGADPSEIARAALGVIFDTELFGLTHAEFRPMIEKRHRAIESATTKASEPNHQRVALAKKLLQDTSG